MEKVKIHYDKDGWVCNRYPRDIPIDDDKCFIEVDESEYSKTLGCDNHHAWRVVDGKLVHERYEETPEDEQLQRLRDLREEICFPIINRGNHGMTVYRPSRKKNWPVGTKTGWMSQKPKSNHEIHRGFLFQKRSVKKMAQRCGREAIQKDLLVLKSLKAIGELTVANAIAVKNGHQNGEMEKAQEEFESVDKELNAFLMEQAVKKVSKKR